MKNSFLLVCWLLSITVVVDAQVSRKTIVEHFTNTKCSICANKNPGLNGNFNLHPQVLHISIHPSSPYSSCYLSQQNMVDNDARTNYYGVYGGTPRIVINGNVLPGNTNYTDTNLFNSYSGVSSFSMAIQQYAVGVDSILSRIVIHRIAGGNPLGNVKLFAGLVEDTVFGNGGNGELKHYNVLRKSLFTSQGLAVTLPANIGDSLVVTATTKYSAFWDQNRIATVSILQDATTKQVIQSELSSTAKTISVSGVNMMMPDITSLIVFPNPVGNTIIIENLRGKTYTYQFINTNGAVVKSNSTQSNRIDISDLANGTYTLKVNIADYSVTQKVVVLH